MDVLDREVPTCPPGRRLADVRGLLERASGLVVVVNDAGVVLGLLEPAMLDAAADSPVEAVMSWGPATIRPSEELASLTDRMERAGADAVLVTSSDGRLLGLVARKRAEAQVAGAGQGRGRAGRDVARARRRGA